ncbi:Hypothetical protein BROD_1336 [Brucella sp. NF 2653]|uniref:hypothetical protein n=1 Tax=unclassified Brucella TaxID=2632610 RepID=UPI0001BD801C|nr:hypothetical protein [Brucella sp. 09RB8471]APX68827.1 hypothetical protein BKD03_05420 [Brucella sp. 09RB8471]EEZ33794.1 predicted protein [Brucella sp. 83/13]EFM62630.1 Hypothetical protein BROD_1336 [Brucella sp. NF 2653]MRN77561.1 hypothetical protein [Brucella sp. 10RB9210]
MVLEIEAACFFVKEDCRSGWRFLRGTAGFPACFGLWRNAHSTLSGGLQHVVQAMWAIMIAKGFNLHKNVCPWLIRHEIMMRQFVLLKRGDRMGGLG